MEENIKKNIQKNKDTVYNDKDNTLEMRKNVCVTVDIKIFSNINSVQIQY